MRGGDNAAFERFYELRKSGVWFTCKSLLKNEENARDIMQDTYLAAYTFKDIYYDSINDNGIITGITEDDKLITFDASRQTVLFTGEMPEGGEITLYHCGY